MIKTKIEFVKHSNLHAQMITEDFTLLQETIRKFKFPADNYWHMPAYKAGRWDGKIPFVQANGMFQIGIFRKVLKYVNNPDLYDIIIDEDLMQYIATYSKKDIDDLKTKFLESCDKLELPWVPYSHQSRGALKACLYKRGICEHVTSAGKSLTIALSINHFLQENPEHNVLILVPRIGLVEQFVEDLMLYDIPSDYIGKFCGYDKSYDSKITVSTWQSLLKADPEFMERFDVFICDECLHPDSNIKMGDGSLKPISDISEGELVLTKNESTGMLENKKVVSVYHNMSVKEKMYELTMDNGDTLKITGNHKVMTTDGIWKRVDELDGTEDLEWHG